MNEWKEELLLLSLLQLRAFLLPLSFKLMPVSMIVYAVMGFHFGEDDHFSPTIIAFVLSVTCIAYCISWSD